MTRNTKIKKAMIFAAGRGRRMRHLSDQYPKPMLEINGRSIIDRLIEKLLDHGITEILVNAHYQKEKLIKHLELLQKNSPRPYTLIISEEETLLETGGGAKHAIRNHPAFFKEGVFWAFNGDMLWDEASDEPNQSLLNRMEEAWNADAMEMLISLYDKKRLPSHGNKGDYHLFDNGRVKRTSDETAPYLFAGARIATTQSVLDWPDDAFSYLKIFDAAERDERLFGLEHHGAWYHLSNPELLAETEAVFQKREARQAEEALLLIGDEKKGRQHA